MRGPSESSLDGNEVVCPKRRLCHRAAAFEIVRRLRSQGRHPVLRVFAWWSGFTVKLLVDGSSGDNSKVDENQDTEKNAGSGRHPCNYICALIFFGIVLRRLDMVIPERMY
jgi:hypothetical protein